MANTADFGREKETQSKIRKFSPDKSRQIFLRWLYDDPVLNGLRNSEESKE